MPRKHVLILAVLSLAVCTAAIAYSQYVFRTGFPLDDAWIHQTYARSLAKGEGWAYVPGFQSAGSTSPLWSMLLATGQFMKIDPLGWAFGLGWLALLGLGITGEWFAARVMQGYTPQLPLAGSLLVLEWHLIWAALSGMETLASALIYTVVMAALAWKGRNWLVLGLLTGLAVWIRPDGITLLGPLLFTALLCEPGWQGKMGAVSKICTGLLAPLAGYLILNQNLAGTPWPNTFYAKAAEYAVLQQIPFPVRLLNELSLPLLGAGLILLPGVIWTLMKNLRTRAWGSIAGMLWWLGYAGLYAWRLPVTYQHGRYMIPAMPIYFLWGVLGMLDLLGKMRNGRNSRLAGAAWAMAAVLMLLGFGLVGIDAYARDVAVIETEVVNPARWIAEHTEPGSLIAAHDIGALGYFGERPILDLAGLISPEVIPAMTDPVALRVLLDQSGADYLMLSLGWYGELSEGREVVYRSDGLFAPLQGAENTVIVRWGEK